MRSTCGLAVVFLGFTLQACGGSGTGSPASPTPTPTPPTTGTNVCSTALTTEAAAPAPVDERLRADKRLAIDRDPRYSVIDAVSLHKEAQGWRDMGAGVPGARVPGAQTQSGTGNSADIGEIAVIQDEGDLIAPPNTYDLRGVGLRFTRNAAGGYDVRKITATFRSTLGRQLTLGDDDSTAAASSFTVNFYGRPQTALFVNSDGNITFEEEDKSSTERNVARLLTGPPRVAAFLADLDPTAGGRIFLNAASDQYTVTWCSVRGFDSARTITTQLSLLPDGSIEMQFADAASITDAVIGVSPGRTGTFTSVNLSDAGPSAGGSAAVGERFAARVQLDNVAVTRKFYATHPDNYDQLVIWSDASLVTNSFAYETTIANEIRGIGVAVYDASRDFGSAGRLRSLAVMDWIGKYPDDPRTKFLGENNTLSVLGQEVGHRWLAFLEFRDRTGTRSDLILGRDQAHWSFFFDSDGSVMEGNDIEDLGGGSFRTADAVRRYSLLDQYAMGVVGPDSVPPFFYVEAPTNMSVTRNRESSPQVGVTFNGTRREVLVNDIIAVHGARLPAAADAPKEHRQAFIYIVSAGRSAESSQVQKLDNIRRQWEEFFLGATDGRMRAITVLR
ncbi:MAG: hypothetical protein ABIS06_04005 [Vicinamibacterales bacterium]